MDQSRLSRNQLRVIVVDEELPYPLNTGKRIRTYNLLSRLATKHEVKFLCHRNADEDEFETAKTHFESDLGIKCRIISRTLPTQSVLSHNPAFYLRLALNLLSPLPYLVDKHRSAAMQAAVLEIDRKESVDLWHCEWTPYAQYFTRTTSRPLVISAHNIESLIWQRYSETESKLFKRWYIHHQLEKFRKFERWAFGKAERTITVSMDDAQIAEREFDVTRVDVVENGVDIACFTSKDVKRNSNELLFVGSLDWRPNVDGIIQFLETAFPKIRKSRPDFRLRIVGRKPPQWLVDQIHKLEFVELNSDVPDVRPFLNSAALMIVPLRVGGGSRLKILEAAAMKLPIVSTRIGAEGLELEPDKHLAIAESIPEMAEPVLDSIANYDRSRSMAIRAHQYVSQVYDWNALAEKLDAVWRHAVSGHRISCSEPAIAT